MEQAPSKAGITKLTNHKAKVTISTSELIHPPKPKTAIFTPPRTPNSPNAMLGIIVIRKNERADNPIIKGKETEGMMIANNINC